MAYSLQLGMILVFLLVGNYGNIFPVAFVKDARAKLPELEKKLKLVSENHQAERKELVATHAQLSQGRGCSSQESGGEGPSNETESLRAKLISLSARQKQLLRCFTNQKEITSKAAKLAEREVKARKTSQSGFYKRSVFHLMLLHFSNGGASEPEVSSSSSHSP